MWLPLPLGTPVAAPRGPRAHQALVEAELDWLEGVWAAVWGLEGTEGWLRGCILQAGIDQLLQVPGAVLTGQAAGKLPGRAAAGHSWDGFGFKGF